MAAFSQLDPEERQALEALCDWLATKCAWPPHEAPAKNARIILQDALTKPAKPDGLREALRDCQCFLQAIADATEGSGEIHKDSILRYGERMKTTAKKLAAAASKALDADSARQNAKANKPAFPSGRWAVKAEGGA